MKAARVSDNKKKIGRPLTGVGTLVGQRWRDVQLEQIDQWRKAQPDLPGRAEAIRRLVELGLTASHRRKQAPVAGAVRAKELAATAIDKMSDGGATADDQANRKRRLLKGPEEFRHYRVDRAKVKR